MKKKYFKLAILATMITVGVNAQVSRYTFSQSQDTYTPLANPTVVASVATSTNSLDVGVFTKPLPFSFNFNGQDFTSVNIYTDGFVAFGTPVDPFTAHSYAYKPISSTAPYSGVIAALADDLEGLSVNGKQGEISYEVSGTAPNRVYTIQWKDFTREQWNGYSTKYYIMNFQISLHEDGVIEKKYDVSAVGDADERYFSVGLRGSDKSDFATRKAENSNANNWTITEAGTHNYDTIYTKYNILPPSGLVFKWTPGACLPSFQYDADGNMITQVIFNTISKTSPFTSGSTPVYENFTNISTDVDKGATYPISVKGPSSSFPSDVVAYIDFNQNGDFSDAGEEFYIGRLQPANPANAHTVTANITIPTNAVTGATKMRIVKNTNLQAASNPNAPSSISGPCDTNLRAGQVEEYTVNILDSATPSCAPVANFNFDFEGITATELFSTLCWDGNYKTYPTVSVTNMVGGQGNIQLPDNVIQIYKGMGIAEDITLVMPEVSTTTGTHQLKFDIEVALAGSPMSITGTESIIIGTVADSNNLASFQAVGNPIPVNATGTFSTPAITFPAGHTRLAMKFNLGTQPHKALVIDNVKWQAEQLSTKEINKNNANFGIYPNPASDIVTFRADKKIEKIEIYNAAGQIVLTSKENQLSVASLSKGLYISKATLADGVQVFKKLIKK